MMVAEVDTLYIFQGAPYWFRYIADKLKRKLEPAPLASITIPAMRYHVITVDQPLPKLPKMAEVTIECDADTPIEDPFKRIVHVPDYDTARGVEYGELLFLVDSSDRDSFLNSLEELSKLASRFGQRLIVEFNKRGDGRLNYTLSLLAYKMKLRIREVSFLNITSYIEGRNIVYGEVAEPMQATVYGRARYPCPHAVVYGIYEKPYRVLGYTPCPAMAPWADPYVFLMRKIYPDLDKLLPTVAVEYHEDLGQKNGQSENLGNEEKGLKVDNAAEVSVNDSDEADSSREEILSLKGEEEGAEEDEEEDEGGEQGQRKKGRKRH